MVDRTDLDSLWQSYVETVFCAERCEVDDYNRSVSTLRLMTEVVGVDPVPSEDHDERVAGMQFIASYHEQILEACKQAASEVPCRGRLIGGVTLTYLPERVHCPIVASVLPPG